MDFKDLKGFEEDLKRVNEHIARLCSTSNENMQKMLDWVLGARGKQIRPILTLLCSRLSGKKVDATEMAAVIEICHTASLIHDDIIDDADMRRGQLSVRKKFSNEMAVYCGDFMIFSAIGRTNLTNKPWYKDMFGKLEIMCNGELGQFDSRYNTSITEEEYIANIIGKTSAMFEIACGAGAYEGKCSGKEREAVNQFARNFGVMFQLSDDVMDFISDEEKSKKSVHEDFWSGYYTMPAIKAFQNEEYGPKLKEIAHALRNGSKDDDFDAEINNIISISGGIEYTKDLVTEYGNKAKNALEIFKSSNEKRKLFEIVDYVGERVAL